MFWSYFESIIKYLANNAKFTSKLQLLHRPKTRSRDLSDRGTPAPQYRESTVKITFELESKSFGYVVLVSLHVNLQGSVSCGVSRAARIVTAQSVGARVPSVVN